MNVCVTLMGSQASMAKYVWLNTYTLYMYTCVCVCVASRATAYHVYWRILRAAAAAARNLHLRMRCKLPMHDLCVCERERGSLFACKWKAEVRQAEIRGAFEHSSLLFTIFALSPEEVKMQKVSAISLCSLLVAFITHAKNVRVGKQCRRGSQRCRAQRGAAGDKGVRGNVLGAGCVRWVCLRCLLEIHDCLAHMPHNVAYIWAPRVLQLTPPAMRRLCCSWCCCCCCCV